MNKIYILNQKLENLQSQKKLYPNIESMSIIQFAKYKKLLKNEDKINNKIYKLNLLKKEVNFLYDINTKSWIENPKINIRTYYKLEQKAAYKKDLVLYKIGVLQEKPQHPVVQNLNAFLEPIITRIRIANTNIKKSLDNKFFSKFTLLKKLNQKYNLFISNTLPHKMNNLAINAAKIGIKGYKQLKADCRFVSSSLTTKKSFMYFKSIIDEANKQILTNESKPSFRESLKVKPENFISTNKIHSIKNNNSMQKNNHPEYIL